jgi:predicted GIY-YIG superfamily endonuclease
MNEDPTLYAIMYYVYILRRETADFYIGYTSDLKKRFKQHQNKEKVRLIYYEAYISKEIARARERRLKYYGSAWRALKKRIIA